MKNGDLDWVVEKLQAYAERAKNGELASITITHLSPDEAEFREIVRIQLDFGPLPQERIKSLTQ